MTSSDAPAQPGPAPAGRLASWLDRQQSRHIFLLALLVFPFHLYLAVDQTGFTFDDLPLILTNPYIRDWRHLFTVLSAGRAVRGFTLMLDYSLWGLDPAGFHVTNLILHITSVILLYLLVFQIFRRQRLAFLAALLFGYHPIQTEAVIGIAHRKEMLAMSFFCLAYLSYLRWGKSAWGMGLSLAAYLLALLSKQVAVALPLVLLAQELILPRAGLSRARRFLPILAFVLLPGFLFLLHFQDFRIFGRFQPVDLASNRYPVINLSMAIEQLKPVATPEIIEKVNALKSKKGTEDLRKVISDLADNIENRISTISAANPDTAPLVNPIKTLNILMDLYFSL